MGGVTLGAGEVPMGGELAIGIGALRSADVLPSAGGSILARGATLAGASLLAGRSLLAVASPLAGADSPEAILSAAALPAGAIVFGTSGFASFGAGFGVANRISVPASMSRIRSGSDDCCLVPGVANFNWLSKPVRIMPSGVTACPAVAASSSAKPTT